MFLHLCILTLFGVHESSATWLKPLLCLLLFKGKPLSYVSSIKPSRITYHHALCHFDPMLKRFLKKKSFFSCFVLNDVGHLIAYLLTSIFLSTSTLYLGRRPINTSVRWYLQPSVVGHLVFGHGFSLLAPG